MASVVGALRWLWRWLEALDTSEAHRLRDDRLEARLARLEAALRTGDGRADEGDRSAG
ncbi:MAG TPA: hypothetical protein VMT68_13665 [Caulobacteraceae bacterium]|nr:hypothetical protein [Caulobacteraceae bacterium]